jgi:hypothetical protein
MQKQISKPSKTYWPRQTVPDVAVGFLIKESKTQTGVLAQSVNEAASAAKEQGTLQRPLQVLWR